MENLKDNENLLKTKHSNIYMENLKGNENLLKTKHSNIYMKEYNQLLMNKKELKKLSKSQLINRLMKLENQLMKKKKKKKKKKEA